MTAKLFTPVEMGGVTLPNRIVISPMCQYAAVDGSAQPWHHVHYGMLAMSGAGTRPLAHGVRRLRRHRGTLRRPRRGRGLRIAPGRRRVLGRAHSLPPGVWSESGDNVTA